MFYHRDMVLICGVKRARENAGGSRVGDFNDLRSVSRLLKRPKSVCFALVAADK
jgi:hypothetical protein